MYRNHFSSRISLAAFLVAVIALSLAALLPAAAADAPHKVTLRLWGGPWGIPTKDQAISPWDRSKREVFEEFQREHPNIQVISSTGLTIQGPASESNFLLAMAGGAAPDVFYVNFRKLHTFVSQGMLAPLDDFLADDPHALDHVYPSVRKVITIDGHVYTVPWFQTAMALMYRKDMFRDAGLDPDRPPRNWDELYEYSQKLTIPEKGQYGFFFPSTNGTYFLSNFIWQAGGEIVDRDAKGNYRAVFNSPAGVEALKFFAKMVKGKWTRNGKTYEGVAKYAGAMDDEIKADRLAMWFADTYDSVTAGASTVNPAQLGIAPMPAGPTGIRACQINAGMWGMSSQVKDPEVRKAAWEFIKFMASDKAEEIRTRTYVENGLWKYVSPEKLEKYGYKEYSSEVPAAWLDASKDAFLHGRPEPNGPNLEMIYLEMDPPLQAMYQNPNSNPEALLNACANRINTKLLGNVPPAEMHRMRALAWTIFFAVMLVVASVVTLQVRSYRRRRETAEDYASMAGRNSARVHVTAWLFMAPAVLSILAWAYYPLLRGMVMAFQDYKVLGGTTYVGLDNFIHIMSNDIFWRALLNSLVYVAISLSIGFFIPIFLALMLAEVPRGKMLYRTLYYLPAVTSGLVIMFLWKWFYDKSPDGLFNTILAWMHIPAQEWLNNSHLAMLCVILPVIWAGAGPGSIIYLAALKSIPEDMYEAADLDGAGIWAKIRHIVLPMLKPLIIINFVGAFIGAFKAMENVFVMTGGGPNYATHVIGLDIWYNAFMYLKFGLATSEAWIMGSLLIGFTIYQLRILKDLKFSAGGG